MDNEPNVQVTTSVKHIVVYADGGSMGYGSKLDAVSAYERDTRIAARDGDAAPVAIETREERITTRVTRWVPEVAHA